MRTEAHRIKVQAGGKMKINQNLSTMNTYGWLNSTNNPK